MYEDAARIAAYATDQIRRFGRFDPAGAANTAWAASDVLHTAAKALGNPHLRAADAYDRDRSAVKGPGLLMCRG
jgi:hypothetical protein